MKKIKKLSRVKYMMNKNVNLPSYILPNNDNNNNNNNYNSNTTDQLIIEVVCSIHINFYILFFVTYLYNIIECE